MKSMRELQFENFHLQKRLTTETREKLEALDLVDQLKREKSALERRVAYFERMIIDLDQLPQPKD